MQNKQWFFECIMLLLFIGCSREEIDISKKELFVKHIAALGNGDKALALNCLPRREFYTFYIDGKKVGTLENVILGPTRIYQKLVTDDKEISKVLEDERTGWQERKNKVRDLRQSEILTLRLAASYSDFIGYYQASKTFEIKRIVDVRGQPCYEVAVQSTLGSLICRIFVSKDNYLVIKRESQLDNGKLEVYYSDFEAFNGVSIARTLLVRGPQGDVIFELDNIDTETDDAREFIDKHKNDRT